MKRSVAQNKNLTIKAIKNLFNFVLIKLQMLENFWLQQYHQATRVNRDETGALRTLMSLLAEKQNQSCLWK